MSASETRQDCAPNPETQNEHRWLQRLVGDWMYESEASMGPGEPPQLFRGTETVRSLGDVWTLGEGRGEMSAGAIGLTLMTLGYDVQKKRFVGSFVGSMMTSLWVYDGELDKDEKVLTLYADGPSFTAPDKTAKYKDLIEFKSEDHRTLTSYFQDENDEWHRFMTANYRRKK